MKKKHRGFRIFLAIAVLLVLAVVIPAALNRISSSRFDDLDETDRKVLTELNTYIDSERRHSIWQEYRLGDHAILAIHGRLGRAYLVNPAKEVNSLFAKKVELPESYSITAYRISATTPQLLPFLLKGNFNTVGDEPKLLGSAVYFTRYTDDSVTGSCKSDHYITFLTHESFHYYMQGKWTAAGRFDTSNLTDKDLDLLEAEYKVLAQMQEALEKGADKAELQKLAKAYVQAADARFAASPAYMKQETQAETEEGTATYIGVQASQRVGYDFGIMRFASANSEPTQTYFDSVVPLIREGKMDRFAIATDMVYESGGLLCQMLDALGIPGWQRQLNAQTKERPVTLYDILNDYVKALPAA